MSLERAFGGMYLISLLLKFLVTMKQIAVTVNYILNEHADELANMHEHREMRHVSLT